MAGSATRAEMLDVLDDMGRVIGTKSRAAVHRDGDWHRVFHCQVVAIRGSKEVVVLQRRSHLKAAFPRLFDISAAGHLAAGEEPTDGVRELEEELGFTAAPKNLVPLGTRRLVDDNGEGHLNREITSVFLLRDDRPLADYVLQRTEVDAVFDARIDEFLELLAGTVKSIQIKGVLHAGSLEAQDTVEQISLEDLVPGFEYWKTLMIMSQRFVRKQLPLSI
ncbi:MAG: NUDIX hydrolase [Actinobacteria bacterium]|jgi:isopentenyldiphosphate isomerase|nr:NUDIX hydrolase [Actinomycetota bacterium]